MCRRYWKNMYISTMMARLVPEVASGGLIHLAELPLRK
jgi:hypothetical protein